MKCRFAHGSRGHVKGITRFVMCLLAHTGSFQHRSIPARSAGDAAPAMPMTPPGPMLAPNQTGPRCSLRQSRSGHVRPARRGRNHRRGNKATKDYEIQKHIHTRKDREFDPDLLQSDVRRLITSNLFRDVKTYTEQAGGVIVRFKVLEQAPHW